MTQSVPDARADDRRESIAIRLFLEAIYEQYEHDFRSYSLAHMKRRLRNFLDESGYRHFGELQHEGLYDERLFYRLLQALTVNTTEMFRDPKFYLSFRNEVVPVLATYPSIKIWHAGCSTGEEVYSMAILLKEVSLYDPTLLYATDVSEDALKTAREGIYPTDRIQAYTRKYQLAAGTMAFSDYYISRYKNAVVAKALRKQVVFAAHNLVTDSAFSEFPVVVCRNVMIYFNRELQARVLKVFDQSICRKGFLCLGSKESLAATPFSDRYKETDHVTKIYRRCS
ncbi:MAG: chemotaxis protein methyltransferase CheR [Kiritimatiellia bacterium]|jgi:chemotaxis protein methyltransferase CheR